ncbi:MAG: 4Fe-4S binding protein [Clostridia bacterium]|nr:4Fe-4S binding protein [Clostridia bacterium]
MKIKSKLRLIIQCAFAALSNGYLKGFLKGRIYSGPLKAVCVPGMNCYSCPGALGSCPIGSLQAILGSRAFNLSLYVLGFLTVTGTLLGRAVCSFLCPFGLIQDLLYKIPFPKKSVRLPGEKALKYLKYVMLFLFVIILPSFAVGETGVGAPFFCKYVCPVGTLEAGVPLVLLNKAFRYAAGALFTHKLVILAVILILSVPVRRPFCRYLCPLGALYGFFNRFSFYRYTVDREKCTSCGACEKVCDIGVSVLKKPNSADCIRCGKCVGACPGGALKTVFFRSG